jgi:hypothetical protein
MRFEYRYPGYLWQAQQVIFGIDEKTLYDEAIYKEQYTNHNRNVFAYFRNRRKDLLVLNLSDQSAMHSLCTFLGMPYNGQEMPHLNKSSD